ncbi:hypothetical protein IFU01_00525 [Oxalobacteraceae sp. CFBP 8763]|nr:hypothetical protein [Oxalobacteraceae sp. CFBP 8763]
MKLRISCLTAALFALSALSTLASAGSSVAQKSSKWPWEIRYVLFAEEASMVLSAIAQSKKFNEQQFARGEEKIYLGAHALFELTSIFAIPGARPIGLIVLTFNGEGRVLNQKGVPGNMSAQRIRLDRLVLMRNSTQGPSYHFAYWAQGIPGDVTFSPAVCSSEDNRRYVVGWDVENYIGNFGCREWTAQLYDRDQPYIDVTSYASRGAYIGALTGWSRFEDPPKPVIGRQGKTWLCLHECPPGEKPGVIPDIRAWTTKHGFPMPTRPSKQPLYPNADYMDDLNEFWQQ